MKPESQTEHDDESIAQRVRSMLSQAEETMLIEKSGSGVFRWAHDKVQEAVLSLGDTKHSFSI